jgi:hypothetical protein
MKGTPIAFLLTMSVVAGACFTRPGGLQVKPDDDASPTPTPCIVPGGTATASATDDRGTVRVNTIFNQSCDLRVRVSSVRFEMSFTNLTQIARIVVKSPERQLSGPLVVYDLGLDGPVSSSFSKELVTSQSAGTLDEIHTVVCSGRASIEVIFAAAGATPLQGAVLPSNTGKC